MQEAHSLDAEVILACATHVLSSAEGLQLYGNGLNMKAIAFSIDNSLKELIQWHFSNWIDHLIDQCVQLFSFSMHLMFHVNQILCATNTW